MWLQAIWFITGTFIPLFILGALSIGVAVFIVFLLFLISTIILSVRQRVKWLASIGMLLLGGVGNFVLLLIIITLGNSYYR